MQAVTVQEQTERAFPREEYEGRLRRLRAAMAEQGVDALVCVAPESLFYLSGYDANTAWSEQALVVTVSGGEPTLVIRDIDAPIADGQIWLRELAAYRYERDDPAEIVAGVVRSEAGADATVALEYGTAALSVAYAARLERALGAGVRDGSALVGALRVRKTPAELAYVRAAAAIAGEALDVAKASLRPGITEIEFAAEIEYALRTRGSEYPGMPTWMASGAKTACSHASPSTRTIGAGEPVKCSFAAVLRRYHVTTYQAFHIGEPPPLYRQRWDQCMEALDAALGEIRPGAPLRAACAAGTAVMERDGIAEANMGRWGYGVGIAYPPTWLEPLDITLSSEGTFDVGMVFCLHVSMSAADPRFGFSLGANYTVTDAGVERVNPAPPTVHVV